MTMPETAAELSALYVVLRDELMDIDAQLATRRIRPDGTRSNTEPYREWRKNAVHTKQVKTRQLARVKERLAQVTEQSSTQWWRDRAVSLAVAIEEGRAQQALSEYQQALSLRKEERVGRGNE